MKILFCGGGTLGPVTPLIAVLRCMRRIRPDVEFAWIGTANGPEAPFVEAEGVSFHTIPVAKLARYPSRSWLTFPIDYLKALRAAKRIIGHERPDAVFSAGGFMQVPVMRAAARLGIPCAIHQLDATPILSNKAVARLCAEVTASFAYPGSKPFGAKIQTKKIATPCRFSGVELPSREEARERLGLESERPVLFVTGGGTGAASLNAAIASIADSLLSKMQIVHQTGKGKAIDLKRDGYRQYETLDEGQMLAAYVAADLVVSRAGFGALSELAALHKAVVAVPLPNSPQLENLTKLKGALAVVEQDDGFGQHLGQEIIALMEDEDARKVFAEALSHTLRTDDGTELAKLWLGLLKG
ncbi:MAG: glycosyltransferase [Patescibacteria group bacterium]|nr:glycosyltransferase [Patescibacteria group bacterium]